MSLKIQFTNSSRGGIELFLLGIIVIGAFFLVGGAGVFKKTPANETISVSSAQCCDSGSGDACKPLTGADQTIEYPLGSGIRYGLLRSKTEFVEGNLHLKDSNQKATIGGVQYPIVLNNTDTHKKFHDLNGAPLPSACTDADKDKYLTDVPKGISVHDRAILNYCTEIPNEQIIYVCKKNCPSTPTACSATDIALYDDVNLSCYGDASTQYDAYFRLSDYNAAENTGIPDFVKNCKERTVPKAVAAPTLPPQTLVIPTNTKHDNLQLNTFGVTEPGNSSIPWFSPFCKPAIYLYPEKETNVSVEVKPVGPFTYTTPLYTPGGWNVTAFPDGKILSNGNAFPYLYYEADIPSLLIARPSEGFSIPGTQINVFLLDLLPKMGLNQKETTEMAAYWQDALPISPYYFIGVIPETVLNSIAPLSINPKPTTTIRVALYFQETSAFESLVNPKITKANRNGFTVVEWGGILKTDKPFTCLQ